MISKKDYKKTIFQLDELIRHLLVDNDDIKDGRFDYWFDYWKKVENENNEVYNEIYVNKIEKSYLLKKE